MLNNEKVVQVKLILFTSFISNINFYFLEMKQKHFPGVFKGRLQILIVSGIQSPKCV